MRVLMGVICGPNGIFYARKKVPDHLTEAVAQVLNADKPSLSWLKRSLGTRDKREASILAKPVLMEFDRTLAKAEASLKPRPLRDTLSQDEIRRMADYYYASRLAEDDDIRQFGTGSEEIFRNVARQLAEAGIPVLTPFSLEPPPAYGLTEREMYKLAENIVSVVHVARDALARGDLSYVEDEGQLDELLTVFGVNLDRKSRAYRELGLAVLRKEVAVLEALWQRQNGEPIETPRVAAPDTPEDAIPGSCLSSAIEGWKKAKRRSPSTVREFEYAVSLFEQLHGGIAVASITRSHVRQFREALQLVPARRAGKLRDAPLPELVEWSRSHPENPHIAPATINKLLAGPMAIATWAYDNGLISEDTPWTNPFGKMLLEVEEAKREPWELADLRALFASSVFTNGTRPRGGGGEAAYWLPL